ncbi:hypothetical protein Ddc_09262 [Ditylenchus destructor]|nr:hypothetical protein Ddc_09262 [Ditylenchus destructor]
MMKKTEDKLKARRRSSSASRTLATTVNLVDRIGASLRISSRRKPKEKQSNDPLGNSKNDEWLRSGAHYARIGAQSNVGIERRRSTCSAVFFGSKQPRLYFADEELDTEEEPTKKHSKELRSFSVGEKTSFLIEAVEVDSVSEIKEKSRVHSSKSAGDFARRPSSLGDALLAGAGELDRLESPQFIDDTASEDEDDLHLETDIEPNALSMALVPLAAVSPLSRSRRSSGVSGISVKTGSGFGGAVARSCPGTPQMQRRRYLKEGATQLTSLSTLCTHHRYLFLFNDLLLVSKQK